MHLPSLPVPRPHLGTRRPLRCGAGAAAQPGCGCTGTLPACCRWHWCGTKSRGSWAWPIEEGMVSGGTATACCCPPSQALLPSRWLQPCTMCSCLSLTSRRTWSAASPAGHTCTTGTERGPSAAARSMPQTQPGRHAWDAQQVVGAAALRSSLVWPLPCCPPPCPYPVLTCLRARPPQTPESARPAQPCWWRAPSGRAAPRP